MLGDILNRLTDPATAAEVFALVATQAMRKRVAAAARAEGAEPGAFVAARVRHLLDHGGEEVWLDLVGAMAGTPQPAAAALARVLEWSFPDAARVRVMHTGAEPG